MGKSLVIGMGIFEKLVDLKDTFEGKLLAVFMAIVLVLGMTNVYAFAAHEEQTADDSKVVFDLGVGANVKVSSGGEYQLLQGNTAKLPYVDVDPGGSVAFKIELDEGYTLASSGVQASAGGMQLNATAFVQTGENEFTINNVGTEVIVKAETVAPAAPKLEATMEAIVDQAPQNQSTQLVPQNNDNAMDALVDPDDGVLRATANAIETTVTNGVATLLTGSTLSVGYFIEAQYKEGWVLVVPLTEGVTATADTASFDVSKEVVNNQDCLVIRFATNPTADSIQQVMVAVNYQFPNGVTAAGITQSIGQLYEGKKINDKIEIKPSTTPITPTGSFAMVTAVDETISVSSKALNPTSDTSFTARKVFDYADATNDQGKGIAERKQQEISYDIQVSSTGSGKAVGRAFQEYVTVYDEISGLKNEPASVTVTNAAGQEVNITGSYNNGTYSFNFPATVSANTNFSDQLFTVTLSVDKLSYMTTSETEPVDQIANKAWTVNKPVDTVSTTELTQTTPTQADPFGIGFYKGSRSATSLTVQKMVDLNGSTPVLYDATQQSKYGTDANGTAYDAVAFTLKKQNLQGNYEPIGPAYSNVTIGGSGTLSFANLDAGNYKLVEEKGINPYFKNADASYFIIKEVSGLLKVFNTNQEGANEQEVDAAGYQVVNTYLANQSITFTVKRDVVPTNPTATEYVPNVKVNIYVKKDNQWVLYKKGVSGSTNGKFTFDADPNAEYKIEVDSTESLPGFKNPEPLEITTKTTDPILRFVSNSGSFKLSKTFVDATGNMLIDPDFEINYSVYKATDVTNGVANTGAQAVYSEILTNDTNGDVVQHLFPVIEGGYVAIETQVVSVVDAATTAQYKAGAYAPVTIEVGKYGEKDSELAQRVTLSNASQFGQLTITNKNTKSDNLLDVSGFTYTFVGTSGEGTFNFDRNTIIEGKVTLPAGSYTVTSTPAQDYNFVSINGGATATVTVTAGSSVPATADFVHAKKPTIKYTKLDGSSNPLDGATFVLYKLESDGLNYKKTAFSATSAVDGSLLFNNLDAGTYVMLETVVPHGYVTPGYVKNFYNEGTLLGLVAATAVTGAPSFEVLASENGDNGGAVTKGQTHNITNPELNIAKIDGADNPVTGSTFTVYGATDAGAIDTTKFINTVKPTTIPSSLAGELPQGTYYIVETEAPAGFVASSSQIKFTVNNMGKLTIEGSYPGVSLADNGTSDVTVTVKNYKKPTATVKKTDRRTNTGIKDATFTLYKKNEAGTKWIKQGASNCASTSNDWGELSFANLDTGEYALIETTVPNGYLNPDYYGTETTVPDELDSVGSAKTFKVEAGDEVTKPTIDVGAITNTAYPTIKIEKKSGTGANIAGATFTLFESNAAGDGPDTTRAIASVSPTAADPGMVPTFNAKLKKGVYWIVETEVPEGYVADTTPMKVTVDETGTVTLDSTTINTENHGTWYSEDNTKLHISIGNVETMSLTFTKYGETKRYDSNGNRLAQKIHDASFTLADGSNNPVYFEFDVQTLTYNVVPSNTPGATTTVTTNASGNFSIKGLTSDGSPYTLNEPSNPPSATAAGLDYDLIEDLQIVVTETKDNDGKVTGYTSEIKNKTNGKENVFKQNGSFVELSNLVNLYQIELTKLQINIGQTSSSDGSTIGEPIKKQEGFNGEFEVYKLEDFNTTTGQPVTGAKPVDTLTTGTANRSQLNTALSRQLPAGKYIIIEVGHAFNSDGKLYTDDDGDGKYELVQPERNWMEFELKKSSNANDQIQEAEFANGHTPGVNPYAYLRAWATKFGVTIDENGNQKDKELVADVAFDVYPAYELNGVYTKLSTTVLERVYSGTMTGTNGAGSFMTKRYHIDTVTGWGTVPEGAKVGLLLVEAEDQVLPDGYNKSNLGQQTFVAFDTSENHPTFQTNGVEDSLATPIEIYNYKGTSNLHITKKSTGGKWTGTATFELYRVGGNGAPIAINANGDTTITLSANDAIESNIAAIKDLDVGYYYLKEVTAPAMHNDFGTWTTPVKTGDFTNGYIGDFVVYAGQTSAYSMPLVITDATKAQLTIQNRGEGTDGLVSSNYTVTYSGANKAALENTKYFNDGVADLSGTNAVNTAVTLTGLADGTYTIVETSMNTRAYHLNKPATTSPYIVAVVENGKIKSITESTGENASDKVVAEGVDTTTGTVYIDHTKNATVTLQNLGDANINRGVGSKYTIKYAGSNAANISNTELTFNGTTEFEVINHKAIDGLADGTYTIAETVMTTPSYNINKQANVSPYIVVVVGNGKVKSVTPSNGTDDTIKATNIGKTEAVVQVDHTSKPKIVLTNLGDKSETPNVESYYTITYAGANKTAINNNNFDFDGATKFVVSGTSVEIEGLADGTYTIKETDMISRAYNINQGASTSPWLVVTVENGNITSMAPTNDTTIEVTKTDKRTAIRVDHTAAAQLVVNMGYIDAVGATVDGLGFAAPTTFTITKEDGSAIDVLAGTLEATGNANEYKWTAAGQHLFLPAGIYKVTQSLVSTEGYALDKTTVTVELGTKGIVYLTNAKKLADNSTDNTFYRGNNTFYNKLDRGTFTIYKQGEGDQFLNGSQNGAQFKLYDSTGTTQIKVYNTAGIELVGGIITIAPGKATFQAAPGNYKLREVRAATNGGYSLRADDIAITIDGNMPGGTISAVFDKDVPSANNCVGIVDAKMINIQAKKTTKYNQDGTNTSTVQTVGGVWFDLYKKVGNDWLIFDQQMTNVIKNDEHGLTPMFELSEGTYKFVERDNPTDQYDLTWIDFDQSRYGVLANSPEFDVVYTNGTLTLDVKNNADWNGDLLTVDNPYQGAVFNIKKVDYDSGAAIEGLEFTFELWMGIPGENGSLKLRDLKATTDEHGILSFDPISRTVIQEANANNTKFYIKEVSAPSGYVFDQGYGTGITEVNLTDDEIGTYAYQTTIKNKFLGTSTIGVTKDANKDNLDDALAVSGDSITYTLTQNAPTNDLPLAKYKLIESGLKFHTENAISPIPDLFAPHYTITNITAGISTSKKTVGAAQTPVYTKIVGLKIDGTLPILQDWTTSEIAISGSALTDVVAFHVEYSDNGQDQVVGYQFVPATVTMTVDIDQYVQTKNQNGTYYDDVRTIKNDARVEASNYSTATANKVVAVPAHENERPSMHIKKTIVGGANDTNDKFKPGEEYEYEIVLTNTDVANTGQSIKDPIILDVMQNDAMSLVSFEASNGLSPTVTSSGNCAIFTFAGTEIAPQQTITLKIKVKMHAVMKADEFGKIANTAYGTSATPVSYTKEYPYGASFVADATTESVTGAAAQTLNDAYMHGKDMGLYVKSTALGTVARSGTVQILRSISTETTPTNERIWVSSEDPQEFSVGDTIFYRAQTSNDSANSLLENVILKDTIFTKQGDNGTSLTTDFLNRMTFNNDIAVYLGSTKLTTGEYTLKYYDAGNVVTADPAQAVSFEVVMNAGFKLGAGNVLSVQYSMTAPSVISETDYEANTDKTVNTQSTHEHNFPNFNASTSPSNTVVAKFVAPTTITGEIWLETAGVDGIKDTSESRYSGNVKVSLYKGAYAPGGANELLDEVVTSDGTYTFTGKTSAGVTYDLRAKYPLPNGPAYTVVFTNPDSGSFQFTKYTPFVSHDGSIVYSHVKNVDSNVTGATEALGLYGLSGSNVVNAGLMARPTVTYLPGDDAESRVTGGMPVPNPEKADTNQNYTVSSAVPERPGYAFVNWEVQSGIPAANYGGGNTFVMPYENVVLVATWAPRFDGLDIEGYTGVYDSDIHGVTLKGADKLLPGDEISFISQASGDVGRTATVKSVDASGNVMVTYMSNDMPLQEFLNAYKNVLVNGSSDAIAYKVKLSITRATKTCDLTADVLITKIEIVVKTDSATRVFNALPFTRGGTVTVTNGPSPGTTPIEYAAGFPGTSVNVVSNVYNGMVEMMFFWTTGYVMNVQDVPTPNGYQVDYGSLRATNYNVTTEEIGSLQIEPVKLTVKTRSDSKVYDTTPLTQQGTIEIDRGNDIIITALFEYSSSNNASDWSYVPLVGSDAVRICTAGSQTNVGQANNGFKISWMLQHEKNYELAGFEIGRLNIDPVVLTLSTESNAKVYDTTPLTMPGNVAIDKGKGVVENAPFAYSASDTALDWNPITLAGAEVAYFRTMSSQTDVGASANEPEIGWGTCNPINYKVQVDPADLGTLEVTPESLYIETDSAAKLYDNTPLTASGTIYLGANDYANKTNGVAFTYDGNDRQITLSNGETMDVWTTGAITDPGATSNTWDHEFNGTAKAGNYLIPVEEVLGELVVYTNDSAVIVVTPSSTSTYDGQVKTVEPKVFNLPAEYVAATVASNATATHVGDTPGTEGIDATADDLVLTDTAGNVVYDRAAGNTAHVNVAYTDGKIKVNPTPLQVNTESATKVFDGAALTAEGTVSGFVNNETASFAVTGEQLNPGTSENTYQLTFDQTAVETDYTVAEDLGTLEVTPAAVPPPDDDDPTTPVVPPADTPVIPIVTPVVTQIAIVLGEAVETLVDDGAIPAAPAPESAIEDDETPLANHIGCWVHYYIILGIVVTAVYSIAVLLRRRKYIGNLNKYEDTVLNGDLSAGSTTEQAAQPGLDGQQPAGN